jgi:hypothetical protein
MIGWLCWSGLSEGAQVGTGSPPWYLLSDRWSVRSKVILIIACRHSDVFLSVHLCSEWQIQLITDCPLVNATRRSGLPLLCYYGVQGGMLHIECICGGMDTVALVWTRSGSSPWSDIN